MTDISIAKTRFINVGLAKVKRQQIVNRRSLTGKTGICRDQKYAEYIDNFGLRQFAGVTCMLADREVGSISGTRQKVEIPGAEGTWYVLPNGGALGYYEGGANSVTKLPAGTVFKVVQEGNAAASATYWVRRPDVDYDLGL